MSGGWKIWVVACAMVLGMYAYVAPLGRLEKSVLRPEDTFYNLLVQGFRTGQLNLKKEVPTRFARLTDPYDPVANALYKDFDYGMRDLSYYKGRLYMYFGVTPALIIFWPWVALTGHYLFDRQAVTIFFAVGILAGVGLLRAMWRRYFADVSIVVVVACALALGLATGLPILLPRSGTHEVATSCGYMLTMLALVATWCTLHEPQRRTYWLVAASVAYGLAVGARPSLLFGAVILLAPVVQAWPEWRRVWKLLVAAVIPIALIGLGLMLYNAQRFGSPFEFGWRYQLAAKRQLMIESFSPRYLWFNFRINFLAPAGWSARFPFVRPIAVPPWPAGYYEVDPTFGILTNIPLVWLALAAPLAWRRRPSQDASVLRLFVVATAALFGLCALTVGLFCASNIRYTVDFLPALILLAVVGILGLERVLAPTSESGLADRLVWRRVARWGWGLLLAFSVVFNILASIVSYGETGCGLATVLVIRGRIPEAIGVFEKALRVVPDFADGHYNLGSALWQAGKSQEAIQEFESALRLKPDYTDARLNLGTVLAQMGKPDEAMRQYEEALRIKPDSAPAHQNIGFVLYQTGWVPEAIKEFETALRFWPDYPEAHNSLGGALFRIGKVQEAIAHYEAALRISPDYAEAHYNLGIALAQAGRLPEAMEQWQQAVRLRPDDVESRYNLGIALQQQGRVPEAITQFEQILKLRPDYTDARNALARLRAGQ